MESPADLINKLINVGYSQGQLAEILGCSQAVVSRLASGDIKNPGYKTMDALREMIKEVRNVKTSR